jgi:CO/xanthine dehydrogenase FAD-binding subunit
MNVHLASSLTDALQFKSQYPRARPLLGGTDMLAQWQAGVERPEDVLALESLAELRRIEADEHGVRIGAGVSHFVLAHDRTIGARLPALAHAARTVGAPAIQMMGTVAGNIANASPAADLPPALLVYDAELIVASERGERRVPLECFYLGYRRTALDPDELIVGVRLAWPDTPTYSAYHKVGTRAAQSIARVALAGRLTVRDGRASDVRFAAASVAATPVRLAAVEEAVTGQPLTADLVARARAVASASIAPIDDVRGSIAYRRYALGALVERFLATAGRPRP